MLLIFLTAVTVVLGYPQNPSINDDLLKEIFGTPPPEPDTSKPKKLEDITVSPTTASTIHRDENGVSCICVPYFLCDDKGDAVHLTNSSVTGYGQLDIRFGEDDPKPRECQESVEICCKRVTPTEQVTTPPPPPAKTGCGYRNPNGVDFDLVGGDGNEAGFGEFPWVVAILNGDDGQYLGVGALIHPQVVLTAAHVALKFKKMVARAGEWDTQTVKERLRHQSRLVDAVALRDDFHPQSLRNDMALLRLSKPFDLDIHIGTLCLPEQDEDFDSAKDCFANGWGKYTFGKQGRYAVILKKVKVDMVPFDRCNQLLKMTRLGVRFNLHESFVCAGGEEGMDTCQGDGGAPLACPMGGDRYKMAGMVAWGIGCGEKDRPAVYVRAAMFMTWVDNIMTSWGFATDTYRM